MKEEFNKKLAAMILLPVYGHRIRRTALSKLLFFADLSCFLNTGQTISGSTYFRLPYGPDMDEIEVTRLTLIMAKFLTEECKTILGRYHYIYTVDEGKVDLRAVEASLDQAELDAVNAVKKKLAGKTAPYLSERTQAFEPWKSSHVGEILDFNRASRDLKLIYWMRRAGMAQGHAPNTARP